MGYHKSCIRAACIIVLSIMAAAFTGCATYYVSSAYCQDWTPEPFIEPVVGHGGFHLGLVGSASYLDMMPSFDPYSGFDMYPGLYTYSDEDSPNGFHTGVKAGLTMGTSGAFTESIGWNMSTTLTGFLYDAARFDPDFISYGGNAELGAMLVAGSSPFWFSVGPEAVYSLELGPYADMRREFAAASSTEDLLTGSSTDYFPQVNLSPSGSTMSILGTMRFTFDLHDRRYISFGGSFGIFDPDFPNNMLVESGLLQYVSYMFLDIQGKALRVYGAMEYGMGVVGGFGITLGTELIIAR